MDVELITPIAMEQHMRFAIREGGYRWCGSCDRYYRLMMEDMSQIGWIDFT